MNNPPDFDFTVATEQDEFCLRDHFLIAMPTLKQEISHQSLIYVCAHNKKGAMGIMINFPIMEINIAEVMEQMNIVPKKKENGEKPVLLGGPILPERGFIIHRPNDDDWQATLSINDEIGVTSSQDVLQAFAEEETDLEVLVALGYAGWGAGELEKELAKNYWLSVKAEPRIIFEIPYEKRWQEAVACLGIDINQLQSNIGNA